MRSIALAGGCFWGLEKALEDAPGIISTECGYANGDPHYVPDYMLVCSGRFGYREAVLVVYDGDILPLEILLRAFFVLIDPTQERRQGNDVGVQYQTGVYWTDAWSEAVVRRVLSSESLRYAEFHTECGPLTGWTRAEEHHQRYLDRNPGGYCHISSQDMAEARGILGIRREAIPPRPSP